MFEVKNPGNYDKRWSQQVEHNYASAKWDGTRCPDEQVFLLLCSTRWRCSLIYFTKY